MKRFIRKGKGLVKKIELFLLQIPYVDNIILFFRKEKYLKMRIWGGRKEVFKDDILDAFEVFLIDKEKENKKLLRNLEEDIIKCYFKYGSTPREFFVFGFRDYNSTRRSEFLTNQHKDKVMIREVGIINKEKLHNKIKFYEYFEKFFCREVCKIETKEDKGDFLNFALKQKTFIVKPVSGMLGRGIEIINTNGDKDNAIRVFNRLQSEGTWIVEELIIQDIKLAEWNPDSVNTVRLPTFLNKDGFHVYKPFFRVGLESSIVDEGALFSVIDEKTGLLLTDGYNSNGESFKSHPNSKVIFKHWQIPKWDDLINLAERIHKTIPDYPYIGWDFALTKGGWVLIEGNWGQFLSEFADKEGIKKEFDSFFD